MALVKNISDSYDIYVPVMTVHGNLYITGNSTNIYSTNLVVNDNIITLNGNVTGVPTLNAGIEVNRGSSSNVALRWNETVGSWQITNDGTVYGNIAATISGAVTLNANLVLQNQTIGPAATPGSGTVYARTPAAGGSGIYVSNSDYYDAELATKARSIAYSIIFG